MADAENARERDHVEPPRDQDRTARDEMQPVGTSGGILGISGGDWAMFGAIAAISMATGIVNALSGAQDSAWRNGSYDVGRRLFWELSSIVVILLLVPLLMAAVRRMRHTAGLVGQAGIGAMALVGFSVLHVAGMVGIRKFVLWLAGSSYDFNLSVATLLYEFRKDVLTSVLIAGVIWLFDSRRELRQAAAAGARLSTPQQPLPELIWLRDGTSRVRVAPREILWIASAGNYIEYSLADGTQHLIRGTLAAAEAELARFRIVRIHRTKLANLDRVAGVDLKPSGDFELTFDTGQTLQGSRRYRFSIGSLDHPATPA
ncbi:MULTISPECIES: LytTR family DNA-binding domain-containing protein [Bradyrhizobium]|uniref:LytTR family DNA-binding domain-containing protein n=1 Tax=Bradyrhizobium TaxID=374 RepID=UPI001B8A501A|nr:MULTISPECIES: LytTR family DNA-binding domain-containing protein [Bradyrhizobium]MBR0974007.1 LytTR family transcriptional regulator DNA-binding domain-containing protein [Bradyrhizobium japonicum]